MRILGINLSRLQLLLLVVDLCLLLAAVYAAYVLRLSQSVSFATFHEMVDMYTGATFFIVVLHMVCFYIFELYNPRLSFVAPRNLAKAVVSVAAATLLLAVVYYFFPSWRFGRGTLLYHSLFILVAIVAWRALFSSVVRRQVVLARVALVGIGPKAEMLLAEMSRDGTARDREVVALLDARPEQAGAEVRGLAVRSTAELRRTVQELSVQELIFADEAGWNQDVVTDALSCKVLGIEIREMVELYKRMTGKVPVLHVGERHFLFGPGFSSSRSGFIRNFWRVFDIGVACLILLPTLPLIALSALLVLLLDGRPILFVQARVGKDERPFRLMKFRTMVREAEKLTGPVWAAENDPRVTRLGRLLRRTRLDELPQLVNVLQGDMSVIGPRPERPEFVADLKKRIPFYSLRFAVRPGLTGWAQVNFRYGASEQDALEKLQYELYYIQELSVLLNAVILLKTVQTVLLKPGS